MPEAQFEHGADKGDLCLCERGKLLSAHMCWSAIVARGTTFPETLAGQRQALRAVGLRELPSHSEHLRLEQLAALQLKLASGDSLTEMRDLCLLDIGDEVPAARVFHGDSGKHFVWRVAPILATLVKEQKVRHQTRRPCLGNHGDSIAPAIFDGVRLICYWEGRR
jgi:hypothetical protein